MAPATDLMPAPRRRRPGSPSQPRLACSRFPQTLAPTRLPPPRSPPTCHTSGFITLAPPLPASFPSAMEMMDTIPETPALPRSRWSVSTSAASPALRSRWSSTLSSIHSAHAVTASPKTFSFCGARRHLPLPIPEKCVSPKFSSKFSSKSPAPALDSTSMAPYANPRAHAHPMGSATVPPPRKKQRKLTVANVQVQRLLPVVGRPRRPPFSPPRHRRGSGRPTRPRPRLRPIGAASTTTSEALHAAYTTQRSPRRPPARLERVERERVVLAISGCQQ
ncbi:hypothetical protein DFH08DRAFT_966055 [Mycena albidolilacea]|uniref:Uncharacterized protein n=1 Tax=Mycena albidolilacea TaxID=1033008 RepID=A0AAD6ZPQ2_9AGAR|nr:hypothetical protein DFH08DRAFT_966055 [Mycena albidolilacea]